jgi:trigger factor
MRAGDTREVPVSFPQDHRVEALRGKTGEFAVTAKEVKRKQLPELDDDFAADAAGFDSLAELRDDVRAKLLEADQRAIEAEFREAALDAAVAEARIEVPDSLVEGRARELWDQLTATLERQGIAKEAYLRISGKSEQQIIEEAKPDAERALKREAVLAAVVEAESIEPTEEELLSALEHSAEHENTTPRKLLDRLRERGRLEALKRDLAARQAVDMVADAAHPIPVEQAKARDKLWTPGKEEQRSSELWTPGS